MMKFNDICRFLTIPVTGVIKLLVLYDGSANRWLAEMVTREHLMLAVVRLATSRMN
jgi:hypothetical protein